jgi:hypothetical protein
VVGFLTARLANENHARGEVLDRLQRECEELEAIRARREARANAHVPGEPDQVLEDESVEVGPAQDPGDRTRRVGA